MIITLIVVAGLISGIIVGIYSAKTNKEKLEYLGMLLCGVFGLCALLLAIIISINRVNNELHKTKWQEKRAAIVYQMEHNMYFGDALGEFNADLKQEQMLHENPWTNWLIGDYIMEIDPIDLRK